MFQWNEGYSVNYPEIDRQHKRWCQLAHDLHVAVVSGRGKAALGQTLARFIAYTRGHFASEERLMVTHGYEDYPAHKNQHEALLSKIAQFQQEFEAGRATIAMEFLRFLQVWLGHHIHDRDSKVGAYLNLRALVTTAREAQMNQLRKDTSPAKSHHGSQAPQQPDLAEVANPTDNKVHGAVPMGQRVYRRSH